MNDDTTTNSARQKLARSKPLSLSLLLGLIVVYVLSSVQSENFYWTLLLIPCLSLLMFLPGMLKNHARSYDWLCFVLLIHFTVGVTNAMSEHASWNDYVQTLFTTVLFISAMMTSRWQKAVQQEHSDV